MREIKFRAWDGKIMYYQSDQIWFFFEGNFWSVNRGRISGECLTLNADANAKLMQYTGFKDKNGKEIWEGDIVEREGGDWIAEVIYFNAPNFSSFQLAYRGRNLDESYNGLSGYFQVEVLEVIGNVHENSELLES